MTSLNDARFTQLTLWSEHRILHTGDSSRRFLTESGFKEIEITGVQRYPLADRLYWLCRGLTNGHIERAHLKRKDLDREYGRLLSSLDRTDTSPAVARLA